MNGCMQVYLNMYYALDAALDERKGDDGLRLFLSGASPFTFKDRRSADPAVISEFEAAFAAQFPTGYADPDESYRFVCDYLAGLNPAFASAFTATADEQAWQEAFESI